MRKICQYTCIRIASLGILATTLKEESMDKDKKEEYEKKLLIEALSNMPSKVIETAYLHAINYTLYGEDVTKKWETAI